MGDISLIFPSGSSFYEMAPILGEVEKLLFLDDHDRMDQGAREELKAVKLQLKEELVDTKRGTDKALASLQEALSQIETLRNENEAFQSQIVKLEERMDYETLLAMRNPQGDEEEEENEDALATSVGGMSVGETSDMADD
ncbi:hypothetical protein PanWU01x14_037930 [Parasponia andersonii]|uniref:Uncharacterized protein n=1 Tax=Parasponia andersonii TaxID=3476 RepID=A0A2P5DS05_PARAD|nr:hypothetical protein PanWU01x14_037930 [Parasponia andersonii]